MPSKGLVAARLCPSGRAGDVEHPPCGAGLSAASMGPEVVHQRAWHGHYSEAAKAERVLLKLLLKNTSSLRKLLLSEM
jgi:hypothetical protein